MPILMHWLRFLEVSPAYERYAGEELVTSEFNLLELAYALTKDFGKEEAAKILKMVRAFVTIVKPTDEDYAEASALRMRLKKLGKNLSLTDALGYALARRLKIPFLTGDREFKDLEEVEYVK